MAQTFFIFNFVPSNMLKRRKMKMKTSKWMAVVALCGALLTGACSRADDVRLADMLPGMWYVHDYELVIDGNEEYTSYDRFVFGKDRRFFIYELGFTEPSDSGLYEAGNDYIRLEYARADEEYMLLLQVHSFSSKNLKVSYKDDEHSATARVTLGREPLEE